MDILNLIRAGIFLVGGLVCIIFGEGLNNFKNKLLLKFHLEKMIKDERKSYFYIGFIFIAISIILLVVAINS
jgi:hypothetical protein